MLREKMLVRDIIEFYDSSLLKPIASKWEYNNIFEDFVTSIINYEPEENREYLSSEINNEFTNYVYSELNRGNFSSEDIAKETINELRKLLNRYTLWTPVKKGVTISYIDKCDRWLDNPMRYSNPFETMNPEYILKMYGICKNIMLYICSDDMLTILNNRMIPYYEQEAAEGMQSGHNNYRRIIAIHELFDIMGAEATDEFKELLKESRELGGEFLDENSSHDIATTNIFDSEGLQGSEGEDGLKDKNVAEE